jgi:hypothetical protein
MHKYVGPPHVRLHSKLTLDNVMLYLVSKHNLLPSVRIIHVRTRVSTLKEVIVTLQPLVAHNSCGVDYRGP